MQKTITTLFSLFIILLLTGCKPVSSIKVPSSEPAMTTAATPNLSSTMVYPSTPEEVIKSFISTYPIDQVYAIQYLSPTYVKNLDADTASKLLPNQGDVMGFIIESGSTSAESLSSQILTNVAFQNASFKILFSLEIVEGRWAISHIEQQ